MSQLHGNLSPSQRIEVCLRLAEHYVDSEWDYSNKTKVDSALIYLRQTEKLIADPGAKAYENASLIMFGKYYFRCDNVDMANHYFISAIEQSKALQDRLTEAEAWYVYAERTPLHDSLLQRKNARYRNSFNLYRFLHNDQKQIEIYQCIIRDHLDQGNSNSAERELTKLTALHETSNNTHAIYVTYEYLATVQAHWGNYVNAVELALKALDSLAVVPNEHFRKSMLNRRLGQWHGELDQLDLALKYSYRALADLKEIPELNTHQQFFAYTVVRQIVQTLIKQNKPDEAYKFLVSTNKTVYPNTTFGKQHFYSVMGDCHAAMKNYDLAEASYLNSIKQASLNGRLLDLRKEYLLLTKLYVMWNHYADADRYIQMYYSVTSEQDVPNLIEIYLMRFKIDSAAGKYVSAINHLNHHRQLAASVFSERKSKHIAELESKNQIAKKEQEIIVLQNQTKLQEARLLQTDMARKITLAGVVLMTLLSALLFRAFIIKKRTTRKLQLKQEEINLTNQSLQHLIKEKEWLIKEMHHRVKNNLHTIMSLLESQIAYVENWKEKSVIRDSQHRIQAMTLLHQKLYINSQMDAIEMALFVAELIDYLKESFGSDERIRFELDVEHIALEIGQAVTVALILNESITNSLKYAFPREGSGVVVVSLREVAEGDCRLIISDNGIGLPESFNFGSHASLGMNLIRGLAEDLSGELKVNSEGGTHLIIDFSLSPSKQGIQVS